MFDASQTPKHLKPEATARLREIVRTCMELQSEAAGIMAGEAERLSTDAKTEQEAREAISEWYGRIALKEYTDAAEEAARPAS